MNLCKRRIQIRAAHEVEVGRLAGVDLFDGENIVVEALEGVERGWGESLAGDEDGELVGGAIVAEGVGEDLGAGEVRVVEEQLGELAVVRHQESGAYRSVDVFGRHCFGEFS